MSKIQLQAIRAAMDGAHTIVADYPDCFEYPYVEVVKAIGRCLLSGESTTYDSVRSKIVAGSLTDRAKSATLTAFDMAVKTLVDDHVEAKKALYREFLCRKAKCITDTVLNPRCTDQEIKKAITEAYEDIYRMSDLHDLKRLSELKNEYGDTLLSPTKIDAQKPKIRLYGDMQRIFGLYLYPEPYVITGRPNDGKTELLKELHVYVIKEGFNWLHVTFEDSCKSYTKKMIASQYNIKKNDVYDYKVNRGVGHDTKGDLFFLENIRTPSALYSDIKKICNMYRIDGVSIDYLQLIDDEDRDAERETLKKASRVALRLSKELNMPIIQLSQVTKEKISQDYKTKNGESILLGIGNERGSGAIGDNAREAISINPTDCADVKIINVYKTTHRAKVKYKVEFDFTTGRIIEVTNA